MQGKLRFFSHSGLEHLSLLESDDLNELRDAAASYLLAEIRNEADVYILESGRRYEVIGRSDADGICVGDDSGILRIDPPIEPECWQCGFSVSDCSCNEEW